MPFQPGKSGNPAGRPPKPRALTQLLEKAGNRTVTTADGKKISGKRLLARALWQGVLEKKITFPDGKVYDVPPDEWLTLVQFIYKHIDGPPPQALALTGADGGPIEVSDVRNKLLADLAGDVAADNPDTSPEADQWVQ